MTTDDFAITMACLTAIEQEVRRARAVLLQEAPTPCDAEVWSTHYFPAGHIDPYWIRCTKVGPHGEHKDSHTGLSWPEPETPAQDAHTPREQPQTRSGGTESGEGRGGAQEGAPQGDGLTDDELHARRAHPDWEYATTTCGRKHGPAPEPEGDGWEPNAYIDMGADPEGKPYPRRNWERFEYHDEEYWRRRRTPETKETAPELTFPPENASEPAEDLRSAGLDTTPEQAYGRKHLQREEGVRVMVCGDMEDYATAYNEGFTEGSAGEQRAREAIEWLRQVVNAPLSRDTILDIITDALDGPDVIAAEEAPDGASSEAGGNGEVGV